MSYADGRDFAVEYSATYDADAKGRGTRVEIEKLGGGTRGKSYAGTWRYLVTYPDGSTRFGQDLMTGTPKTHSQAADLVWDFVSDDDSAEAAEWVARDREQYDA